MDDGSVTAQVVVDALRMVSETQKDPAQMVKVMDMLLDMAPETLDLRGGNLIRDLIAEGCLRVGPIAHA